MNIYTMENKERQYFFDGDRLLFNISNKVINDILDLLNEGKTKEEIFEKLKDKHTAEDLKEAFEVIEEYFNIESSTIGINYDVDIDKWKKKKRVQHLWLNISNDCNLRCIYCYGSGGSYGRTRNLMTQETAKKCIDYWYTNLDEETKDSYVCFFGGEPFMNKEIFIYCVNYINELLKDRDINIHYMVTTNGTILDEDYKKVIKENDFAITISMDGGKEITKINRPQVNGESSYYKIKENLPGFLEIAGNVTARVTLTGNNVDKLNSIIEELSDLGFTSIHYELASVESEELSVTEEKLKRLFVEIDKAADVTYEAIHGRGNRVLDNLTNMIRCLHNRSIGGNCSFYADNVLMFGSEGQIFKCHRLSVHDEYVFGNVDTGLDISRYLNLENKKKLTKCSKCIAKKICNGGCAHINLTYNDSTTDPYEPYCENIRYLLKVALKMYSNLQIENS